MEIELIAHTDKEDDDDYLDNIAEQQIKQVGTEQVSEEVLNIFPAVHVRVHDFELNICDYIGDERAEDHGRDHRLVLLLADIISAVDRMHGNRHGGEGEQGGGQGTVHLAEEIVVERHKIEGNKKIENKKGEY